MAEETYFVKFKTSLPAEFVVTSEIITIPRDLKRLGISQVINHLLGTTETPTPFDVSINKELLRTSLRKFVTAHDYHEEQVIEIEYLFAFASSKQNNEFKHDDWVSAIDKHINSASGYILSGSYDSVVRLWDTVNKSSTAALILKGHTAAVKALSSVEANGRITLASASQDQTLKVWNNFRMEIVLPSHTQIDKKANQGQCVLTFVGHTGTVEDCDLHSNGDLIVSGSYDSTIKLWSITGEAEEIDEGETKKRKMDAKEVIDNNKKKRSMATLTGHKHSVSGVKWTSKNEFISSSYDFSLKLWDITTTTCSQSFEGNSVMTGISSLNENVLVTSHADRSVRFWDKRGGTHTILASHKGWVSSVSCNPVEQSIFITGAYDGTVKAWDVRASAPLHTCIAHEDAKVLCVGLADKQAFSSGGSDNTLKSFVIS